MNFESQIEVPVYKFVTFIEESEAQSYRELVQYAQFVAQEVERGLR